MSVHSDTVLPRTGWLYGVSVAYVTGVDCDGTRGKGGIEEKQSIAMGERYTRRV